MTNKEIADRLRDLIDGTSNGIVLSEAIQRIADDLDPPRPEPGTVVWWRYLTGSLWFLGTVNNSGVVQQFGTSESPHWSQIEYKPARIAGPMQEIVDIPPVSEWPEYALTYYVAFMDAGEAIDPVIILTRAEAARREAEG